MYLYWKFHQRAKSFANGNFISQLDKMNIKAMNREWEEGLHTHTHTLLLLLLRWRQQQLQQRLWPNDIFRVCAPSHTHTHTNTHIHRYNRKHSGRFLSLYYIFL